MSDDRLPDEGAADLSSLHRPTGIASRGALISPEEFEEVLGRKPPAKLQMVLVGDDLYVRAADDHWWRHPPYAVCP